MPPPTEDVFMYRVTRKDGLGRPVFFKSRGSATRHVNYGCPGPDYFNIHRMRLVLDIEMSPLTRAEMKKRGLKECQREHCRKVTADVTTALDPYAQDVQRSHGHIAMLFWLIKNLPKAFLWIPGAAWWWVKAFFCWIIAGHAWHPLIPQRCGCRYQRCMRCGHQERLAPCHAHRATPWMLPR